jgi:glycosyltransferase involved in cell wall biosynthesis
MTTPEHRKPTVFIAHASDLLTDHLPNGDGLVAHGFIRELAARGYRLHIATRTVALREALPANAVLHPIPRRFVSDPADRLSYMLAIRRLLARLRRDERIDLVHQMNPVFVGLSLGLLGCGLPVVLGTFVARWPGGEASDAGCGRLTRIISAAARWLVILAQQSHASALLITTPAALDRIAVPSLARRKTVILRHGIDTALFSPAPHDAEAAATPTILFYSHLDQRKGVFVLVEAFREVLRHLPACRLTMVGRGDHEAELRQAVMASGYADRITIRGPVPRSEAPALLRAHSVYCLPSFGEPYATTVLEAMACARPVVITEAGGLPYMVPEAGGLRVPQGDAGALAAALVEILLSPERQRAMGAANRAHIERHHSWGHVVDELESIYARVVARDAPCRPAEAAQAA